MSERRWLAPRVLPGADPIRLDALLESPATGEARGVAVVAPPHPLYGGRMDNPVVDALARSLRACGYAALRFDYRGCGESSGSASDTAVDADADYAAALADVAALTPALTPAMRCAAGYSFGAAAALRALAHAPGIARALVVAPPVSMIDIAALAAFRGQVDVLLGDDDEYAPLPRIERALAGLAHVRLHVLAGTDHFFSLGTAELAARARQVLG
ncbi:MAG TPA: alpha/beta fold hydrolase [Polyangiales bacterium]|nr:alpha/beta fold hydrolase [Polyangiales bacterium]